MDTGFTNRRDSDAMSEYRAYQDREDLAKYRNLYWEQKSEITALRAQIEEMKAGQHGQCSACIYQEKDIREDPCNNCVHYFGEGSDNWKRRSE